MAWTNVQAGASTHVGSNTTITLNVSATTAGNLVVCTLGVGAQGPFSGSGGSYFTGPPSGFVVGQIDSPAFGNQQEVWYNANVGAGITSFQFSSSGGAHALSGQAAEFNFSGLVAPVITVSDTGTGSSGSSGTSVSCTFGGLSASGDLCVMGGNFSQGTGTTTWTSPGGWSTVSTDGATSAGFHSAASYLLNGNVPVTVTGTTGTSQNQYAAAGVAFRSPVLIAPNIIITQAVKRAAFY